MKRAAIYSSVRDARLAARLAAAERHAVVNPAAATPGGAPRPLPGWHEFLRRRGAAAWFLAGGLVALAFVLASGALRQLPRELTQEDIDAAVLHTLEHQSLPSRAARAAESVRLAVVRVRGYVDDGGGELTEMATGSGVVIVDDGVILTNLHVVQGAEKVAVTFYDGLESEARVVSWQPTNDLAVVRAATLPDDLAAATLGTTQRLKPGDEVVAVGFPFGIGPSVTAGVVSGLNREFRSPEGDRVLTRLIQFDAAANPGSSGGPLVTMDGEVVGIVTAIFSPSDARTFVGIGFAVTIEAAGAAVGLPPF